MLRWEIKIFSWRIIFTFLLSGLPGIQQCWVEYNYKGRMKGFIQNVFLNTLQLFSVVCLQIYISFPAGPLNIEDEKCHCFSLIDLYSEYDWNEMNVAIISIYLNMELIWTCPWKLQWMKLINVDYFMDMALILFWYAENL